MGPGRRTWTVVLVAIALVVAAATYGLLAVDRPQVESVDSEWGTVTSDRTEVETRVGVDNPRLLRIGDGAADLSYTVSLNGIEVAAERDQRVAVGGRESELTVSTWIDNDEIPAWWASHVNRNETTTVRIEPDVVVEYAGVRLPAERWTRTRTVRTDLLEPLRTNRSRDVQAGGRTLVVVEETTAQWGTATPNRSPIDATATVTNPTSIPIPIAKIRYTVQLNDVVVGQGVAGERTVVPPDSTRPIEAGAAIDNTRLDEWWVTHLRNNETSTLTVDFTATLEYGGLEQDVPLDALSYERTFRTDILGSADTDAGGPSGGDEPTPERTQRRVELFQPAARTFRV
ncbi:LEA type 2 family protein [Natrinema salaciae]|uniref:LEA14-like dessication related protein n=1 Tax=Natrinema salaciae TaxID=1186196 RepID=A0A1H9MUX6_9EURY|nr:LEA type 2 family protein [Natrinema salaciae]SER27279.1 LEA14-like dessication related protein [Natrinema salaciae]